MHKGVSGIATQKLKRNYIGFEKDLEFFNISCKEINQSASATSSADSSTVGS